LSVRRVFFLFLDGVGLGSDDPAVNPLAGRHFPVLEGVMGGAPLVASTGRRVGPMAALAPVDAQMGIAGRPQSATGQAAILTGINASERLGEHYGPRPDDRVRAVLDEGNLFARLRARNLSTRFLNAYPQRYFDAVARGKRLLSAIPYAVTQAGQPLPTFHDMVAGQAFSADFTAEGWRTELGYLDAPIYTPAEAGRALWRVASGFHFTFFEHWLTDVLGHQQALDAAVDNFMRIDQVLGGFLEVADLENTLVIVAADHGNVEACNHSRHTVNPAIGLLIGAQCVKFSARLNSLADYTPIILDYLQQ
jgi:2,3-bisphosphoglycerate-independent phosphoglycerate mutase